MGKIIKKMEKEEAIEKEKKLWESDEAWELRKAFLMAHYGEYPLIKLQCLSQLFINVTILGCEYSDSLMEKIKDMGRGISVDMERKKSGGYVKASTAKKRQAVKLSDLDSNELKKAKESSVNHDTFNAKLASFKQALTKVPRHFKGEQMMRAAASSCLLKWHMKKTGSTVKVYIDRFLALSHTFSLYCVDQEEHAINSLIESFLACDTAIKDMEIWFNDEPPSNCYANSISRSFSKIKGQVINQKNLKGLMKCFEGIQMSIIQNTKKLEGWSQQLDLIAGDVLLASRTLSSTECTRPAMAKIADEMAILIAQKIYSGTRIIIADQSHSSLKFEE